MEGTADAGEIVISPATAELLPRGVRGRCRRDPASSCGRRPPGEPPSAVWALPDVPDDLCSAACPSRRASTCSRASTEPEHRQASVAFVHFDGTDELLEREGPERVAAELDRLVRDTQDAVDEHGVSFLASDVDADGGKLILAAGAPRATGDDEERMLLAAAADRRRRAGDPACASA